MKKIFIPALTLLLTGWAAQTMAQYEEVYVGNAPTYNGGCNSLQGCPEEEPPLFEDIFDKPGNESYWKNRFRTYRVYPIFFYPKPAPCDENGIDSMQTVNAHEYQRNVIVSANKGQRMYDSTTYTLKTHTTTGEVYRVNTNGMLSSKEHDIKLYTDFLFHPVGEVTINDEPFMLVALNDYKTVGLVDNRGYFYDRVGLISGDKLYVSNEPAVVTPNYLKLIPATGSSQSASGTKLNFDIRYNGIENNMLSFLIYDAATGTTTQRTMAQRYGNVNINGVNFEIIYFTPEYIEYRIN